jgi:L-2-hydroxyglutarate oxidase
MSGHCDVLIVGGGIVGLATAMQLLSRQPGLRLIVVEKERSIATHQTGRNSGVVHAGLYYAPGSLKAQTAMTGRLSLFDYCRTRGIPIEQCGKLVVATRSAELPWLNALAERGRANGLHPERIGPAAARDHEPHVSAIAALWVPETGIVDYRAVARSYRDDVVRRGGEVRLGTRVESLAGEGTGAVAETAGGDIRARFVVNCAGLHADRLAMPNPRSRPLQIVPFRGEYFELAQSARALVRGLIYPVPDPSFPFLGVHLTRGIDGGVHAGPNAVLALAREGYRTRDVSLRDLSETLRFPGFRRLVRRHWSDGSRELWRSLSRTAFLHSLQRLVPALRLADLVAAPAGIRAQALRRDGGLVDDFALVDAPGALHVCNAPSPAATASLEIGRIISERVVARLR